MFALVVTGMANKQVGFELGATEKTIKVHRPRVMEKRLLTGEGSAVSGS